MNDVKPIQMVDLVAQYQSIKDEVQKAWDEILSSGIFIGGKYVNQFAENLANYLNVAHVIPCANGTDALQAALMALDLKPGDEVITTPLTFVATAETIAILGLKPVFVDAHPDTYTIDPGLIEAAIGPKTKAIIPVHLYGQSADMEPIISVATNHGLKVIEDNAQAIGAHYHFSSRKRRKTGTIGDIGTISFYPSKNLGAYGDAGAISTNDDALAEKLRMIINHGQKKKYHAQCIGVNSRLDALQAAVLDIKLSRLDQYTIARNAVANYYDRMFKDQPKIKVPPRAAYGDHVFHQYTIVVDGDRDGLKTYLADKGIPTMIYYPEPVHLQEAYAYLGYKKGDFPVSERMAYHSISLPMHTEMDEGQIQFIGKCVTDYLAATS